MKDEFQKQIEMAWERGRSFGVAMTLIVVLGGAIIIAVAFGVYRALSLCS